MSKRTAQFDRDAMAKWYAKRHLDTDTGVVEIHYLPFNARDNEIRLLEVNDQISETSDVHPIDFGVDIGEVDQHVLVVLDVTPAQWKAIQGGKLDLPKGWSLDKGKTFKKRHK